MIRRAETPADRLAVIDVAHAAFASAQPLALYRSLRLSSALRARAEWWLVEAGGRIVSSLLSHPLRLADGDEAVGGFGLGSVSTLPAARGQGHASALCHEVALDAAKRGRPVGVLFSAIDPGYYARLGYRVAPAWSWRCEDPASLAGGARLIPLEPRRALGRLGAAWRRGHLGLRIRRDEAGWAESLTISPGDLFFAVGEWGYVRLARDEESLEILELFADDPDPAIRAVCGLAVELGLARVDTWLAPTPLLESGFREVGREKTRPMVRGWEVEGARFWGSDYF